LGGTDGHRSGEHRSEFHRGQHRAGPHAPRRGAGRLVHLEFGSPWMSLRPEVWCFAVPRLGGTGPFAERLEAMGYDGVAFPDSQNLGPDPYIALALAAQSTSRLLLATGVTNPFTRHPAVTAAAIA